LRDGRHVSIHLADSLRSARLSVSTDGIIERCGAERDSKERATVGTPRAIVVGAGGISNAWFRPLKKEGV